MKPQFVYAPFERYADDMVVHCSTLTQAEHILGKIKERMIEYGVEIHPDKTKIVYCMQEKRRKQQPDYVEYKFDFLGYGFQTRTNLDKVRNKFNDGFASAISDKAKKKIKDARYAN